MYLELPYYHLINKPSKARKVKVHQIVQFSWMDLSSPGSLLTKSSISFSILNVNWNSLKICLKTKIAVETARIRAGRPQGTQCMSSHDKVVE